MKKVNWTNYAEVYDLILEYNPAYQKILSDFKNEIINWNILPDEKILDIGAGTGNFTLAISNAFPLNQVYYLDFDKRMSEIMIQKMEKNKLTNVKIILDSVQNVNWNQFANMKVIICVHALYTIPAPRAVLSKMYETLKPGGYLFLCDLGRVLNIFDWSKYFFYNLWLSHGLKETLCFFWKAREILKQNNT